MPRPLFSISFWRALIGKVKGERGSTGLERAVDSVGKCRAPEIQKARGDEGVVNDTESGESPRSMSMAPHSLSQPAQGE